MNKDVGLLMAKKRTKRTKTREMLSSLYQKTTAINNSLKTDKYMTATHT